MLPLGGTFLALLLSGLFGCETGESGAEPCLLFGYDFGGWLAGLLSTGALANITIPLFLGVFALWMVFELWVWRRRRKRARRVVG